MKKQIAVIASADTKIEEMLYLATQIKNCALIPVLIDISTRRPMDDLVTVTAREVVQEAGYKYEDIKSKEKVELIAVMGKSLGVLLSKFYKEGKIQGVVGIGGLQNSVMISTGMQSLPIGFPKLLLSTVANGSREFGMFVGCKDITIMPSVVDFCGVNSIIKKLLDNAAAAIVGMTELPVSTGNKKNALIAVSMMGVINDGSSSAISELKRFGKEVAAFHTTGVGGAVLEELIWNKEISSVMDLCLHEIVAQEVFHGGFSAGAGHRLEAAVSKEIPMVVAPGGLDFIDFTINSLKQGVLPEWEKRKYVFHNDQVAHIKLNLREACIAAEIVAKRLNKGKAPITLILPLDGMRTETRQSEKLYDAQIDGMIFDVLRKNVKPHIQIKEYKGNINDDEFGKMAATELMKLINMGKEGLK